MITLRANTSIIIPVLLFAGEFGKHGALRIKETRLERSDGTSITVNPVIADGIMREQAHLIEPAVEGVVQSSPTYSANGGAGGEDIFSVVLDTGEGAGYSVGDYVRSQTANKHGVYRVNAITSDTLKLECANNEMDIASSDTIEKVTPEGWYRADFNVSHTNLNGLACALIVEMDGHSSSTRNDGPVLAASASERKVELIAPAAESGQVKVV